MQRVVCCRAPRVARPWRGGARLSDRPIKRRAVRASLTLPGRFHFVARPASPASPDDRAGKRAVDRNSHDPSSASPATPLPSRVRSPPGCVSASRTGPLCRSSFKRRDHPSFLVDINKRTNCMLCKTRVVLQKFGCIVGARPLCESWLTK